MKSLDSFAENGVEVSAGTLGLDVLVVYEDLETGMRARHTLERTVQRLEASVDVQVELWRFDLFNRPPFQKQVAKQKADIVILSAHGQARVPAAVDLWFRQWFVRQSDEPRALAVLLDEQTMDRPGGAETVAELSAAARLSGVDVFLSEAEWEPEFENLEHRANARTMLLEEVLRRVERPPARDWGINE